MERSDSLNIMDLPPHILQTIFNLIGYVGCARLTCRYFRDVIDETNWFSADHREQRNLIIADKKKRERTGSGFKRLFLKVPVFPWEIDLQSFTDLVCLQISSQLLPVLTWDSLPLRAKILTSTYKPIHRKHIVKLPSSTFKVVFHLGCIVTKFPSTDSCLGFSAESAVIEFISFDYRSDHGDYSIPKNLMANHTLALTQSGRRITRKIDSINLKLWKVARNGPELKYGLIHRDNDANFRESILKVADHLVENNYSNMRLKKFTVVVINPRIITLRLRTITLDLKPILELIHSQTVALFFSNVQLDISQLFVRGIFLQELKYLIIGIDLYFISQSWLHDTLETVPRRSESKIEILCLELTPGFWNLDFPNRITRRFTAITNRFIRACQVLETLQFTCDAACAANWFLAHGDEVEISEYVFTSNRIHSSLNTLILVVIEKTKSASVISPMFTRFINLFSFKHVILISPNQLALQNLDAILNYCELVHRLDVICSIDSKTVVEHVIPTPRLIKAMNKADEIFYKSNGKVSASSLSASNECLTRIESFANKGSDKVRCYKSKKFQFLWS